MKAYLVIIKKQFTPYKDQYTVWLDKNAAIAHANKHGYTNNYMPFDDTVGMYNMVNDGEGEVGILPVEINARKTEVGSVVNVTQKTQM